MLLLLLVTNCNLFHLVRFPLAWSRINKNKAEGVKTIKCYRAHHHTVCYSLHLLDCFRSTEPACSGSKYLLERMFKLALLRLKLQNIANLHKDTRARDFGIEIDCGKWSEPHFESVPC